MISNSTAVPTGADLQAVLQALAFAAEHHTDEGDRIHLRKGTQVPYLSHLMIVAGIVWESEGDTNQVVAAVLHDVLEDTDVTASELEKHFDRDVAALVAACSDGLDGPRDSTDYTQRKTDYIASLPGKSPRALLITAADKSHNGSAIVADVETHGASVWKRFNGTPDQIRWYYESVLAAVEKPLAGTPVLARLRTTVTRLAQLAEEATE